MEKWLLEPSPSKEARGRSNGRVAPPGALARVPCSPWGLPRASIPAWGPKVPQTRVWLQGAIIRKGGKGEPWGSRAGNVSAIRAGQALGLRDLWPTDPSEGPMHQSSLNEAVAPWSHHTKWVQGRARGGLHTKAGCTACWP